MHMVKVISLSEEAYSLLKMIKKNGMSFSDVIIQNLLHNNKEKTENLNDLLDFVNKLEKIKIKVKISSNIDNIVYGVKK